MATNRPQRANAGRNISKLLEQEEIGDEFYQTAYGGFQELSEDEEYKSEEEADDVVDSDFDLSEKEESEKEDIPEPKAKKRKWLKVVKPKPIKKVKKPELPAALPKKVKENLEPEPRSLRQSTLDLSQEREKIRSYKSKFTKKSRSKQPKQGRKMTQEQLLEEAKQTEIENLASLEAYTRLEAEKKTFKAKKHFINGPIIRYHSVTMPVMATDDNKSSETTGRYSRNFMIFTDTKSFPKSFFPTELPQKPKRLYCKITGLPAKYVDPITGYPYATMQAFRVIRDRYVKEREEKCEERLLQLSNWLEEKKRLKKQTH